MSVKRVEDLAEWLYEHEASEQPHPSWVQLQVRQPRAADKFREKAKAILNFIGLDGEL